METTIEVGVRAVPICWTNPDEGGVEARDVPLTKMGSPVVHDQRGLVTRPEVMT